MGAYVLAKAKKSSDAVEINKYIENNTKLKAVTYLSFYDEEDYKIDVKDNPDMEEYFKNIIGGCQIKVSSLDEDEVSDPEEWFEAFSDACAVLNAHFELEYSSAFGEGNTCYFSKEQQQKMTEFGKLLCVDSIFDECDKAYLSNEGVVSAFKVGDEVLVRDSESELLDEEEREKVKKIIGRVMTIDDVSIKGNRYSAYYVDKYRQYITLCDDVIEKVYPKGEVSGAKYNAGDVVIVTMEKDSSVEYKKGVNLITGQVVTIEKATKSGTYLIEVKKKNAKREDEAFIMINDEHIDCRVDEVMEVEDTRPRITHKSTKSLLAEVKAKGEDYEWYPTTREILEVLYQKLIKKREKYDAGQVSYLSILDIGAGDGKLFRTLEDISKGIEAQEGFDKRTTGRVKVEKAYAIEKSQTLINAQGDDVFVVGTEFNECTLIDKKVDVIFSNPPYSAYVDWSAKIIKEAYAKKIYLVIPKRWTSSKEIASALESRGAVASIVGEFDFLESEDRKARAVVNLVEVVIPERSDPFNVWFDDVFKMGADKGDDDYEDAYKERVAREERIRGLVKGESLIPRLVELYNEEMQHLIEQYLTIAKIDKALLAELGIKKAAIREALQMKIRGVKDLYWSELFHNLEVITSKLTSKSRSAMLDKLNSSTNLDFTANNAYSVVVWVIKNASKYYDSQLVEVWKDLVSDDNIKLYKSNSHLRTDGWRYERSREKETVRYALDYRIVYSHYGIIDNWGGRLSNDGGSKINDLFVIAENLGFNVERDIHRRDWNYGTAEEFTLYDDKKNRTFIKIRAYKNGNMHLTFDKVFMGVMNANVSRLLGWVKSPQEFCDETDTKMKDVGMSFDSNFKLNAEQVQNLLPYHDSTDEVESA